jgi:hypothetical protein
MIPDQLRIQPGQERLSPEREVEARRFAAERVAAQLSTEPVDEPETERLLQKAYHVAHLPLPKSISWLDGPLQLVAALASPSVEASLWDSSMDSLVRRVYESIEKSMGAHVVAKVWETIWSGTMTDRYEVRVWTIGEDHVWDTILFSVATCVGTPIRLRVEEESHGYGSWESISAYAHAARLARCRFFDEYLAPNELHALAHFNERVSGYWLGQDIAFLVRRPTLLARDAEGRLHSARGKCLNYPDGWGFYAWHGVRVPERVILAPETLTREDFLSEPNAEVRRVMQERMGERFASEP